MHASALPPALNPAPAAAGVPPGAGAGTASAADGAPPGTFAKALDHAARNGPARPGAGTTERQDTAAARERAAVGDGTAADEADDASAAAAQPADAARRPAAEPPAEAHAAWLEALLPPAARSLPAPQGPQGAAPGASIDTPPGTGRPGAGGRERLPAGRLPGDPALTNRLPREATPALPSGDGRELAPIARPPLADGRPDAPLPGGAKNKPALPGQPAPGTRLPAPEIAPPIAALPQPPVAAAPPLQAEPMPQPLAPLPGSPALAALSGSETGSTAAASTPGEARLAMAPGHAGFAPALGASIATFVRNGIEHARLHLNPAEMGPVAVQIRLDGQAAQVLMSAAHADTRAALEQAMPTLAGALREAGLTLTGGGVFDQPRDAQREAAGDGGRAARDRDATEPLHETAAAAAAAPQPQRRGVVDLVA